MVSSVSAHNPEETANYDEVSMQESLIFSDGLKDLKNLRTQLYSAAEYFELSYMNDDNKQIVVDTLKDYAVKALVNTVDHLGSVTYKVKDLLDEKFDDVSGTEIRVSCIEQRIRMCQQHIDCEGLSQQSLVINTPKYHNRYILPGSVGKALTEAIGMKSKYHWCNLKEENEWHQFRRAASATTIRDNPSSKSRKGRSQSPSPRTLQRASTSLINGSTTTKEFNKRTVSPHRYPLICNGSLPSQPTTPNSRATTPSPSRPTTNTFNGLQRYPSAPRRSASVRVRPEQERENPKAVERQPSKSKRLLKSLLSRRKSKKDDMLYTYLDGY